MKGTLAVPFFLWLHDLESGQLKTESKLCAVGQTLLGGKLLYSEKETVLAYVDAFNRGDLDGVCSLFTPDAQIWGVLGWGAIEQARPVWKELMEGLRIQLHVEGIISEGNIVAVRYTERGKSVGNFRGAGPTGRSYELTAMEWFEVKGGLIHRRWGARDSASQNKQLGFAA